MALDVLYPFGLGTFVNSSISDHIGVSTTKPQDSWKAGSSHPTT